ncbi:MAG: hypothetical protein Q7T79_03320 [bacterium]|nr:hypothetical protein [bacterium]
MNTNKKSLIELLNKEKNFITRNSVIIMILVVLILTLGLSKINVPIYENVKIYNPKYNENQIFLIKTNNKLSFKKGDTISVVVEKNLPISLAVIQNEIKQNESFLLKAANITLNDTTFQMKEDIIFGKIILGKENLILSIFNNIHTNK